ncbi:MAG: hypothetical protein ABJB11_14200 [Ferruginibacter sp.]
MEKSTTTSRRTLIKSSVFGILAVSIPSIGFAKQIIQPEGENLITGKPYNGYPAIEAKIVSETVGASHFNLDRVKELVNHRPELARATWDWGFGDWETALGAASHVGRRDIVAFLMSKGARPDIFTYAMLGSFDAVKSMIENTPGAQQIAGPHGISLLQHAKNGLRSEGATETNKTDSNKLISYLEQLGDADVPDKYLPVEDADQQKYLGDYKYGDGPEDGFSIKLNMRKLLSLGRLGAFGGALYQLKKNVFIYNGTSSIEIGFSIVNNAVVSLTIHEPDISLTAVKV